MKKFDVIGFGALNVDKLFKVNKIAGREEESFVTEYHESCGGSAANTVVGLARLGMNTGFVGKVANDHEGQLLLENFGKENVDAKGVIVAKSGKSGMVMGFVDKKGERALYVAPGVNDTMEQKEVDINYVGQTRFLHLTSFVGKKSFESQKEIVKQLPSHTKVSLDPGVLYAEKGSSELRPLTQRAFVIFPNEIELKLLTGEEYEDGAKSFLDEGVKIVAVKLGEKGCYITNGKESHLIKSFTVNALDTTGAGDAWNAGFLYGLLKNKSLKECGRLGNFAASKCILKLGARTGLPRLADLQRANIA